MRWKKKNVIILINSRECIQHSLVSGMATIFHTMYQTQQVSPDNWPYIKATGQRRFQKKERKVSLIERIVFYQLLMGKY